MGFIMELITRSVDTGEPKKLEKLTPANNLSPVLLTLVISYSPVSLTPAITFFPGIVVTGHEKPKSLKFIAGVNDTAEKLFSCVNDTAEKFF
jgi:hypothetical protein